MYKCVYLSVWDSVTMPTEELQKMYLDFSWQVEQSRFTEMKQELNHSPGIFLAFLGEGRRAL